MVFSEPTTMLTDYAMALSAAWFAHRLFRQTRLRGFHYWAWAMTSTAVAASLAGTFHGFRDAWPSGMLAVLDYATTLCLVVASYCVLVGTSEKYASRIGHAWLTRVALSLAGFFVVLGLFRPDYVYVIIDYGVSLTVILFLGIRSWRIKASLWLLAGAAVSIAGAAVQMARITPALWFNHNDLYHVIQIFGLYLFYRGALLLKKL